MMADRKRHQSQEGSIRRPLNIVRSTHDEPREYLSSSSSSSSSSYLDISRVRPLRSIRSFFFSPAERRRVRRRKNRGRLNSPSSSSLDSNLAYGTGFIKVHKRRGARREKGKERDTKGDDRRLKQQVTREGIDGRPTTDAEILAIGAGLAKLARDQNKADLKGLRDGSRSEVITVERAPGPSYDALRSGKQPDSIMPESGPNIYDEEGWESASENESEASVDSRLAFGHEPQRGGFFGWGNERRKPVSRKSTVVDPRLFGRVNSLQGLVAEPVGYGNVSWDSTSDFGQHVAQSGQSEASSSRAPLRLVYPVPTSDPSRFEAARSSVVSGSEPYFSTRPDPVDLRQPQPITPVTATVYESTYPTRSDVEGTVRPPASTSSYHKSLAGAALAGVAGATIAAGMTSGDRDHRKHKSRDSESRKGHSRADSKSESKQDRKREKRDDSDREERRERRREKEKRKEEGRSSEVGRDKKKDKRRDEAREETREERRERRERRRDERRSEVAERPRDAHDERRTQSVIGTYENPPIMDPFQYQVAQDSFPTPTHESAAKTQERQPTPHIVTVDRTPDFSMMDDRPKEGYRKYSEHKDERRSRYKDSDSRDEALHNAASIYYEVEHSTAPVDTGALGAAVAAVTSEGYRQSRSEKRRDERRSEYDSTSERNRGRRSSRDPDEERIQEEADKAYREIIMARKIASQVIRSRSASPDTSVINKYNDEEEEVIRILTPPGMEDHKKEGSPYDAPNADFQPDRVITDPKELQVLKAPLVSVDRSTSGPPYLKHDPDALGPRPFLNLVHPTPTPSPAPEKQRTEPVRSEVSKTAPEPKDSVASSSDSSGSKGVTWGRNETKHYEVESPAEHHDEFVTSDKYATEKVEEPTFRKTSGKSKGWGAVAAGIMGATAGMATKGSGETRSDRKRQNSDDWEDTFENPDLDFEPQMTSAVQDETDRSRTSRSVESHIPGAFEDDIDFAATLAAGLQDTGFDPNIVINDPAFHRRESPPGSNGFSSYHAPFSETMSAFDTMNLGPANARSSKHGFVIGEVPETPKDWQTISPPNERLSKEEQEQRNKNTPEQGSEMPPVRDLNEATREADQESYFDNRKLSKKEQKKRDKAARKASLVDDSPILERTEKQATIVAEAESYFETPKKSRKESKKVSSTIENDLGDTPTGEARAAVPVDAFEDVQRGEDEWDVKKSRKKSKRDSEGFDAKQSSMPSSEVGSELSRSSSKKSKDKSRRKSEQFPDITEIPFPSVTPSEGDFGESRKSKKSRDSGVFDGAEQGDTRSVVSADVQRDDDDAQKPRKKTKGESKDDYNDTRSVAPAPAAHDDDSKKNKKDKRSSGLWGLFSSKSEVGARDESPPAVRDDLEEPKKKSKKSKRSSLADSSDLYGSVNDSLNDLESTTSTANGQETSSRRHHGDEAPRGDDVPNSSSAHRDSIARDSFLDNAGILGAGAGFTGALLATTTAQHQPSNATINDNVAVKNQQTRPRYTEDPEYIDPEITERQFRPSIDPQYGDLLPLPPSSPASPLIEPFEDLPELPDLPESRPETPEPERFALRDKQVRSSRRSLQEMHLKSPSFSAVPLKFILGNRSTPGSPIAVKSPPNLSPVTSSDSPTLSRNRVRPERPTSWESAREYRPLYLVESSYRRSSNAQNVPNEELATVPQRNSISTSSVGLGTSDLEAPPFQLSTLGDEKSSTRSLDENVGLGIVEAPATFNLTSQVHHHEVRDLTEDLEASSQQAEISPLSKAISPSLNDDVLSPAQLPHTKRNDVAAEEGMDRPLSPVDAVTKDRSSYLLHSSPIRAQDDVNPSNLARVAKREDHSFGREAEQLGVTNKRQETLDILSSSPQVPQAEETILEDPLLATSAHEPETIDDFALPRSKAQKKKGKKKDKGSSRSSTQDDASHFQTSQGAFVEEAEAEAEAFGKTKDIEMPDETAIKDSPDAIEEQLMMEEPVEDVFTSKSKKDRKKDKKRAKSAVNSGSTDQTSVQDMPKQAPEFATSEVAATIEPSQDDEIAPETSIEHGRPEPTPAEKLERSQHPPDITGLDTSSSTKDRKDKKTSRQPTAWDLEDDTSEALKSTANVLPPDIPDRPREVPKLDESSIIDDYQKDDTYLRREVSDPREASLEPTMLSPQLTKENAAINEFTPTSEQVSKQLEKPAALLDQSEIVKPSGSRETEIDPKKQMMQAPPAGSAIESMTNEPVTSNPRKPIVSVDPITAALEEIARGKSKKGKKSKKSKVDAFTSEEASSSVTPVIPDDIYTSRFPDVQDQEQPIRTQMEALNASESRETPIPGLQEKEHIVQRATETQSIADSTGHGSKISTPDGLNAGYNNDQLSLARQLQEEFGAAGKKSKKDKKERQSLPSTPNPELSRSRSGDNIALDHPRARSLSMEPSKGQFATESIPTTPERGSLYNSGQLDLARQLQAEFDTGTNKRPKKDKKKRSGLSRSTTQDDIGRVGTTENMQVKSMESPAFDAASLIQDEQRRKSPVAAYQEDQLSLARQLQVEFSSGSNKGKKDKKRRSNSQTPVEQPEPKSGYCDDIALLKSEESMDANKAEAFTSDDRPEPVSEQLEEEFVSSGKSREDKKGKTRAILTSVQRELEDLQEAAPSAASTPVQSNDPVNAALEAEFPFVSKKSKKDKKGKKRESLAQSTDEIGQTADIPSSQIEIENVQTSDDNRPMLDRGISAEPEEAFGFSSKMSKKDKKGEKRANIIPDAPESPLGSHISTTGPYEPMGTSLRENIVEFGGAGAAQPESGFEPITKKSKKGKKGKKRESLEPEVTESLDHLEASSEPTLKSPESILQQHPIVDVSEPIIEDEFQAVGKRSRKSKKSNRQDSIISDVLEQVADKKNSSTEPSTSSAPVDTFEEPMSILPEDQNFQPSGKMSKKDKKQKRSSQVSSLPGQAISIESPANSESFGNVVTDENDVAREGADYFGRAVEAIHLARDAQVIGDEVGEHQATLSKEVPSPQQEETVSKTGHFDYVSQPEPLIAQETQHEISKDVMSIPMTDSTISEGGAIAHPKEFTNNRSLVQIMQQDWAFPAETAPPLQMPEDSSDSKEAIPAEGTSQAQMVESKVPDTIADFDATGVQEPFAEAEPGDEWGSFSIKKSKKDKKKRKSGLSTPTQVTPIEQSLMEDASYFPPSTTEKPLQEAFANSNETPEDLHAILDAPQSPVVESKPENLERELNEAQTEEWGVPVTKKSKKDKKKRKSGLSSPAQETIVEKPVPEAALDFTSPSKEVAEETASRSAVTSEILQTNEAAVQSTWSEPHLETFAKEITEENDDEWAVPVTKKSKKNKKRKSGLSTPAEVVGGAEIAHILEASSSHHPQTSKAESIAELPKPQAQVDELDGFGFQMPQKASKGKKGKRASRDNSISDPLPIVEASPSLTSEPKLEIIATDEREAQRPTAIEEQNEDPVESQTTTVISQATAVAEFQHEEISSSVSRSSSKKDKRKRHPTVLLDPSAEAQAVAWADDVPEADVERSHPVIEDIAKDPSLSHIASTVESPPQDDFLRPTKKGKTGVRRLSAPPSPALEGMMPNSSDEAEQKALPETHSAFPVIAAIGVAGASAAYALEQSKQSTADMPLDELKPIDTRATSGAAETSGPTRRLSKKEKRKKSIDKRTPSNDIFDDPALWEDANPKAFQESKSSEYEGGDGFWSPPTEAVENPANASLHDEPSAGLAQVTSEDQNPHTSFSEKPPIRARRGTIEAQAAASEIHDLPRAQGSDTTSSQLERPKEQWNDLPDEYLVTSKKGKKNRKKARLSAWDPPSNEKAQGSEVAEDLPAEFEPSQNRHIERDAAQPSEITPVVLPLSNALGIVEPAINSEVPELESPVLGRSVPHVVVPTEDSPFPEISRHGRTSPSGLSVVEEEPEISPIEHGIHTPVDVNRDSAFVTGSPVPPQGWFTDRHEPVRDSAVHLREESPSMRIHSPESVTDAAIASLAWPEVDEEKETVDLRSETTKYGEHHRSVDSSSVQSDQRRPSTHSPSQTHVDLHQQTNKRSHTPTARTSSRSERVKSPPSSPPPKHESIVKQRVQGFETRGLHHPQKVELGHHGELSPSENTKEDKYKSTEPLKKVKVDRLNDLTPGPITPTNLSFAARRSSQELRPDSAQSHRSISNPNIDRLRTPDSNHRNRPDSSNSSRGSSGRSGRSGTPPLRRSDRKFSGDLRSLSQRTSKHDLAKEAELALLTSAAATSSIANTATATATATPTANEGRVRAKDMADVYVSHPDQFGESSAHRARADNCLQDGFGEGRIGSPRSPTRPHSMRRRQSMQILDLETKVEQLAAENRALSEAKAQADRLLQTAQHAPAALADRDAEIDSLKRTLEWMQKEVARLSEVNEGLTSANVTLGRQQDERYNMLESQYAQTMQELEEERGAHNSLSTDMAATVESQVHDAILQKDQEIAQLHAELEATREQVRSMQRQILESKAGDSDFLTIRDEDYFDTACQQLCQHVQQWVLRFSKFSDMRACRLTSEINNDKIIDRLDNAILDGSDVDSYLADRVKRRDVFMSMTMTMVWEFIFTRYLFGMDRDQRQKLKSLEKLLSEVGPPAAVHQWRATTLTLLSKRPAFTSQREQDTEAVVNAILETLTEILPPPSNLEVQIESQLKRVMRSAVDLSIEMRTQRAEYMMLPPLQPEYDANGDLASRVTFNAALMNERSGDTVSNEDLEAEKAVVRIVLFPLVVKRGDDRGEGDEEIVVCPAQVLVGRPKVNKGKSVRVLNPDEEMGESVISGQRDGGWDNRSKASLQSAMPSTIGGMELGDEDENVI